MEKRTPGFNGSKYLETSLEDHKDNWVLISLRGTNSSYVGKIVELTKEKVNFLPYEKATHNERGVPEYTIAYEGLPHTHRRTDIINYRPSSEQEAINFCKSMNRKAYIDSLRERKEIFELEKINQEIDKSQKKII